MTRRHPTPIRARWLAPLLALGLLPVAVAAQDYRFAVPEMRMQVFVNPDASVRVEYEIVFHNDPRGHVIDAVDVGLFHRRYVIASMTAALDDHPITAIRPSPYVSPGVEVDLGPNGIPPGGRGVFRFTATLPDMVHQDTTRDDHASLRVTPTWFGSEFVTGQTRLQIAIHLPAEVKPDELLHQGTAFTERALFQGRAVAYWEFPSTRITQAHPVAVSFPLRGMTRVVTVTKWEMLMLWWEDSLLLQFASGLLLAGAFAVFFFLLTGGTGCSLYGILVFIGMIVFVIHPEVHLISLPFWPFVFWLMWRGFKKLRARKKRYLPPIATVEGGGIKRGLTAPEAAALLELSPGRLVTLVIFGLLKKQVLRLTAETPLTVAVEPAYTVERPARLAQAAEAGVVLHTYEHAFIDALAKAERPVRGIDLSAAVKGLIDHTVQRVGGFDIEATRDYYRRIIDRAWAQAESLGEVEQRDSAVDKNLEWMLLRPDHRERFGTWERTGYRYLPIWVGGRTSGTGGVGTGPAPSPGAAAAPSFRDVAASFAGWTENVAGQAASSILPTSIGAKSGTLDLSGFDRATSNFFKAAASGGGSSSGGGGCACAGCACACACAGGGR